MKASKERKSAEKKIYFGRRKNVVVIFQKLCRAGVTKHFTAVINNEVTSLTVGRGIVVG
jgi:hypothetical protein